MNIKYIYIIAIFCIFISLSGYSQTSKLIPSTLQSDLSKIQLKSTRNVDNGVAFTQSQYKKSGISIAGVLRNGNTNIVLPSKEFVINVDENGEYYFLANAMPVNVYNTENKQSHLQVINVIINGKYVGALDVTKSGWEIIPIKSLETVILNKGQNTIIFESLDSMFYPEIDCVQVSKNKNKLLIKNEVYENYITSLKDRKGTRSAHTESGDHTVEATYKPTPGANYKHMSQVPIAYTYYKKLSIAVAKTYTFWTVPTVGDDYRDVDPVMHLFKENDPHNYSWYNDDYDEKHPRISAYLPAGDYYLVVRSYTNVGASKPTGNAGLVRIFMDGGPLQDSDIPVSGYLMEAGSNYTGALNYFTGYNTGSAKIWFLEGDKMKYCSEEYTYYSPSDYYWFDEARIKINHPRANNNIKLLIGSIGAWWIYWGNCDVYAAVPDAEAKYMNWFPNLRAGDAIRSADGNLTYNAAAWAGGLTSEYVWNSKWGSPFVWSTWDNYFGNKPQRYQGAKTYTRTGYGRNMIAVYSFNDSPAGISHFAVSRNANEHMHGYSWESKIGGEGRIFHIPNALTGTKYGKIIQYYYDQYYPYSMTTRTDAMDQEFTLQESIDAGLTVIEDVELDQSQRNLVNSAKLKNRSNSSIDQLFNRWNNRINSEEYATENNPYNFFNNVEGKELINLCKQNLKESILYLAEKIFSDSNNQRAAIFSSLLFCEIAGDKYGDIIETIKKDWQTSTYSRSGAYIFPSPETFTKKYAKKIIDNEYLSKSSMFRTQLILEENTDLILDNEKVFSVVPNPITAASVIRVELPKDAIVTLKIIGNNGYTQTILSNKKLNSGAYTYYFNADKLNSGMNFCVMEIDGVKFSRKLLKQY